MDKKQFDSLDESLKENLKNSKNGAEAASGVCELSIEAMESVSGGTQTVPPEWLMKDE